METGTQIYIRDLGEGFAEVNARIEEARRESTDNFAASDAQMLDFHRETILGLDTAIAAGRRSQKRRDRQFRWLVGLMITSLLVTAGLFVRAAQWL